MGAVSSTLRLNDAMSPVLRRINSAMSTVLDSFNAVQRASGRSFNNANIEGARREIELANRELDEMTGSFQQLNNKQNKFNKSLSQGVSSADSLTSKLKGAVLAFAGISGAKKALDLSDTMTSTTARLSMVVDDGGIDALQKKIFASAQASRGAYQGTADSVAKLALTAGEAFSSNDEIIAFSEQINKQFTVAGTEALGVEAAWLQLTQAMGSGVLRGEEYNSILEQAPNIIQSIAKYMGVPKGQLKDMAAEGKITADIVKGAVLAAADETNAKFNAMPKTFAQTFQSMKNAALVTFQPVLNKLNTILNSAKVQRFVSGMTKALSSVGNIVLNVLNAIAGVGSFIADNWGFIGPVVIAVTAAILAQKTALIAYNAIQAISTGISHAKAAADMILAGNTSFASAAQNGFNAALWACPVTWIIAALLVLVAVFVLFTENVMATLFWWGALFKNIGLWLANFGLAAWTVIKNVGLWFGNLGLVIWSFIKNVGLWFANLGQAVWAIIQNVGAWFGNLGMGIWEVLKACAGNIATAFKNGWIDIQIGFWSMVDVIMQGVKRVAELANTCLGWMGVNIDTSGLDFAANKVDELNAKREEYKDISEAWEDGFNTFGYKDVGEAMNTFAYEDPAAAMNTLQYDDVGAAFNTFDAFENGWDTEAKAAGYSLGSEMKGWMGDAAGGLFGNGADGAGGVNDPYADYLSNISDNTGEMADCGDKTTEELAYLRDIAEQEAINRFTTAQVKVDFTSNNNISSDIDIDGMTERFTREFTTALETAAEGDF